MVNTSPEMGFTKHVTINIMKVGVPKEQKATLKVVIPNIEGTC